MINHIKDIIRYWFIKRELRVYRFVVKNIKPEKKLHYKIEVFIDKRNKNIIEKLKRESL